MKNKLEVSKEAAFSQKCIFMSAGDVYIVCPLFMWKWKQRTGRCQVVHRLAGDGASGLRGTRMRMPREM